MMTLGRSPRSAQGRDPQVSRSRTRSSTMNSDETGCTATEFTATKYPTTPYPGPVLGWPKMLMQMVGFWPRGRSRLVGILAKYVVPVPIPCLISMMLLAAVSDRHADLAMNLEYISYTMLGGHIVYKLYIMNTNGEQVARMCDFLCQDFEALERPVATEALELTWQCERRARARSRTFFMPMFGFCVVGFIIVTMSGIMDSVEQRKLSIEVPDYMLRHPAAYTFTLSIFYSTIYVFVFGSGAFDILYLSLCEHMRCKLQIMEALLRHVDSVQDGDMGHALENCVRYHHLILRVRDETELLFSRPALFQVLHMLVSMSAPAARLLRKDEDLLKLGLTCGFASYNLMGLLFTCWFGDIVADAVSNTAYGVYRMGMGKRAKTALLLVILRTQKPLHLTASKLVNLTLELFLDVMQKSYSVCSALLKLR